MEFITVMMEGGKKEKLEVLDELNIGATHYVIVAPEDSDLAYAYRVTESNGFREYESVGEGKEFDAVLKRYNENHGNA